MSKKVLATLVLVTFVQIVTSITHPTSHFGTKCRLCHCFVKYDDRDFVVEVVPYKKVDNPYEATEDDCLKLCWDDESCRAVTYGLVGGKDIFACELYQTGVVIKPLYVPYINLYIKKSPECRAPAHIFYRDLILSEPGDQVAKRKSKYVKLNKKVNPFNIGK
uniref:Apple domain-containing protein n=1 Tax=Rhabditophanes sp. KR3021 TaxID=114890 RepID=A0AC35TYQ9_9BILA